MFIIVRSLAGVRVLTFKETTLSCANIALLCFVELHVYCPAVAWVNFDQVEQALYTCSVALNKETNWNDL